MIRKTGSWLIIFISFTFFLKAQAPVNANNEVKEDSAFVNSLIKQGKDLLATDQDKALALSIQARNLAEKIDFLSGKAYALKNIGMAQYFKGEYIETLESWHESLNVFEQIKDETGIANMLSNMAAVYGEQGNEEKGLEYSLRSLSISEKLGNKLRILSALNAIGSIYYAKEATKPKALEYLLRALPLCEEIGDSAALGTISENIGEIYLQRDDYDKAVTYFEKSISALGNSANASFAYNGLGKVYLQKGNYTKASMYHEQALEIAEKLGSKPNMVRSLDGIANIYKEQKDYKTALEYYHRASAIAEEIRTTPDLKDLYNEMAEAYSKLSDYKNAFKYHTLYADIKDTLYNIDIDKKLGRLQFAFDLDKKEGEIKLLTKDKAITDQKLQRQRLVKNAFMAGLALVFLIAVLIFRSYRIKVKTHKILDKQKQEIEGLLLNILPAEVAKELQVSGRAVPRFYESVSVMFTDFKGFTTIADKMSPQDLVEELSACFVAFDEIIGKHNLEKIKTIGDSYMCAGGIPVPDAQHVFNMVKASLEVKNFMRKFNQKRKEDGLQIWDLRIGIHTGPIVAGVVGKKKYAYDIWGSTVNIASRMESNGEPGQVNISSSVYDIVKDNYNCTYRGKIYAKNVGEIDMYFLDDEGNGTFKDTVIINEAKKIEIESSQS